MKHEVKKGNKPRHSANRRKKKIKAHQLSVNVSQLPGHRRQSVLGGVVLELEDFVAPLSPGGKRETQVSAAGFTLGFSPHLQNREECFDFHRRWCRRRRCVRIRPRQTCCVPQSMCSSPSFTCHISISPPLFCYYFISGSCVFLLAKHKGNQSGSWEVSGEHVPRLTVSEVLWVVGSRRDQ